MENNIDILNILEQKSEEPLIVDTQKLLKMIAKQEKIEEQLEIIKKDIKELTQKKHHRIKEIYNNDKIDEEKLNFALKLVNNDEKIYKELNEIKVKYKKEKTKNDLKALKTNIKQTCNELEKEIETLINIKNTKIKPTLLQKIKNKIKTPQQDILIQQQLEKIIQTIEKNRIPVDTENISENYFNLKEEYLKKEQFKSIIDKLYKKCRTKDLSEMSKIKIQINQETNRITEKIEKDIIRLNSENRQKNYDPRLTEYVYNKQKNYISHSIDHSKYNTMFVNILTILKLINDLEKNELEEFKIIENLKDTNQKTDSTKKR